MTVRQDVLLLKPMEVVEMFEWDARQQGDTAVFRWHPGTTIEGEAIIWNSQPYLPYPITGEGFDVSINDKLPRPRLKASNINGELGAYLRSLNGALGAKVTRRRTLGKYLDAVNFPDGNPNADPTTAFPEEIFYVARKLNENPVFIELELAAKWDVTGVMLPRRQVIASICQWVYRSPECGYSGGPVLDTEGHDICHKTLEECSRRFPPPAALHTSAFPASLLARQ